MLYAPATSISSHTNRANLFSKERLKGNVVSTRKHKMRSVVGMDGDFSRTAWTRRRTLASFAGLALAACSRGTERVGSEEILVVSTSEITGIDPARTGFLFARTEVTETLTNADDAGLPTPGLAQSWHLSPEKRVWTFVLRPTARFHDGTAVTPEAVAGALNRARKQPGVFDYVPIETIEPSDGAVIVRLSAPSNLLTAVLAHYSASIFAPSSFDANGLTIQVVGSGPYRVHALTNQGFALEYSPTWDGPRPSIERFRFLSVSRAETRSLMAESGQADIVFELDPASIQRLRARDMVTLLSTMTARTVQLNMNAAHPFLEDVKARRAFSLAIDRKGIAVGMLRDAAAQADQLFPPIMEAWHANDLPPLTTDVAEASRLLAELGWKRGNDGILVRNGSRFSLRLLTYINRPELPPIATALQAQLRAIGVETTITVDNQSSVPAAHRDGSLELALVARGYVNVADPVGTLALDFLEEGGDWGAMGWSDARCARAIRKLAEGASEAQQPQLRREIAGVLHEELPVIPIAWYTLHAAVSRRIKGFSIDPLERSYRIGSFGLS